MRELSLGGFLDRYLRELYGSDRLDLAEMARIADMSNPRMKEPLVVYAAIKRPENTVRKMFRGTTLIDDYDRYFRMQAQISDMDFDSLPDNYRKLYRSYLSVKNQNKTEQRLKTIYRDKILDIHKKCTITDYRICKQLNINPGNLHSFLSQGKSENLSLDKVRKVYGLLCDNCK